MQAPPTTRAPLLRLLIPLMLGISLTHWFPKDCEFFYLGIGLCTGLSGYLILRYSQRKIAAWALLAIGGMLLSCTYAWMRTPVYPRAEPLPPREVKVTLKIDRLFSRKDPYHRQGGIATITNTPKHLQELTGQKVSFFLKEAPETAAPQPGEVWAAQGVLDAFPVDAPPFGFAHTQQQEGIYFTLNRGRLLERTQIAAPAQRWLAQGASRLKEILAQGTPEDALGIYTAMLLGDKQGMAPETKRQFIQTGTWHLFAISGLHIGVIAFALFTILRWLTIPAKIATCMGLSTLLLYVLIIGSSPSAMRAFLMISFLWGAYTFKRRPAPFSALVASALCVLMVNPLQLWNPGFQLSYAVVSGILLYGLPLARFLKEHYAFAPDPFLSQEAITPWQRALRWGSRSLMDAFSITLSATLLSTPLVLGYFKLISPGAFLLNLVLIPLASLTITMGFISLLCGLLWMPILSHILNTIAGGCIFALTQATSWSAQIPYLFWEAHSRNMPALLTGILGLTLLLILCRPHILGNKWVRLLGPLAFVIIWTCVTLEPASIHKL